MDILEKIKAKIHTNETIKSWLQYYRFKEQKIVFTNGCFDILHCGHIEFLAKAAQLGNVLIIGLNTDSSIKRIKGINRPINDQYARALTLASLHFVDNVVYFNDDTPESLIQLIKPNFLVKGAEYDTANIVGSNFVSNNGGTVVTIEMTEGYSTTKIIEKIKNL